MKTEVIVNRELFGSKVAQKSKSEFFSATDLVKAGNKWRVNNDLPLFKLQEWLRNKSTIEFIEELEKKYNDKVVKAKRGRGKHTWVHPLLFIDLALAISPKLKIEVYDWLFDHLMRHRNESGDSYKEMCAALYTRHSNHSEFPKFIEKVAGYIKLSCGVENWKDATGDQLKLRDNIHKSIKTLCVVLDNPREAVRIGVKENIKD